MIEIIFIRLRQTKQQMSELKDRVMRVIPQPKKKSEDVEKPLLKISPLPPIPKSSKPNAVVEPVDVTALPEEIRPHGPISSELRAKKNRGVLSIICSLPSKEDDYMGSLYHI